jgi:subtilisin family serine protease
MAGNLVKVNVLLNTDIDSGVLTTLSGYGKVKGTLPQIDAVFMQVDADLIDDIAALPFVIAVSPDADRHAGPVEPVAVSDFHDGLSTWDLDAINVTDFGPDNRQVDFDGTGVYIAVLDTGLLPTWRQYFPEERIAEEYARTFGGGGSGKANVSEPPNKWQDDTNSHGTHVTSTILGYSLRGTPINGVAPMATVIPVKVLNNNGSGSSSAVAAGIVYIGDLKGPGGDLEDYPVVINMSLGGSELEAVEEAAILYAIEQGVIIVASAGNEGEDGMGYPGAYEPVISAAASGWVEEWTSAAWWYATDVADPTNSGHFYITDFSSRELSNQDLDVAAPGSWVVGPYQVNQSSRATYYYLGGTSMASPHVAGTVALMAQKLPTLTAAQAEAIIEGSATPLPPAVSPACPTVLIPFPPFSQTFCWGADATGAGLLDSAQAIADTP